MSEDTLKIEITQVGYSDLADLKALEAVSGRPIEPLYFETCLILQAKEDRIIYIARQGSKAVGFAMLNFKPRYAPFQHLEMPEIQDILVDPAERRQGIARQIIKHCEATAKRHGATQIGIGVGLSRDYGPAQRLYATLGYLPDASGAVYERQQAEVGRSYPLDDDFCLMLYKDL